MTTFDDLLSSLTPDDLLPALRSGYRITALSDWQYEKLSGGNYGGVGDHSAERAGVARFGGHGLRSDGHPTEWVMVLKMLPTSVNAPDQQETTREADLYASGWLDNVNTQPFGIRVPRYYGKLERTGYGRGLWLEAVPSDRSTWAISRYVLTARQLAWFNTLLYSRYFERPASFSHGWFRGRMQRRVPLVAALHQAADHPLIKRLYSPSAWSFMLRLWDAHPRWLDLLDSFPQTFCHLDAFRRNLIARATKSGTDETVALDWAFAGLAPFGADLAPLVWVSAIFREINPRMILGSEQMIFASYIQGLTEAGWHGSVQQVRFAYLAMALMNVAIPTELMQFLDDAAHPALERGFGFTVPEIISNWAVLMNVAASYWNEVRALEASLTNKRPH